MFQSRCQEGLFKPALEVRGHLLKALMCDLALRMTTRWSGPAKGGRIWLFGWLWPSPGKADVGMADTISTQKSEQTVRKCMWQI